MIPHFLKKWWASTGSFWILRGMSLSGISGIISGNQSSQVKNQKHAAKSPVLGINSWWVGRQSHQRSVSEFSPSTAIPCILAEIWKHDLLAKHSVFTKVSVLGNMLKGHLLIAISGKRVLYSQHLLLWHAKTGEGSNFLAGFPPVTNFPQETGLSLGVFGQ